MSLKSRYNFIKRMYPEYLFIFETNKGLKYSGIDKCIIDRYCKNKNVKKWLQKKQINYLVIDNTTILEKYEAENSMYEKYYYLCCLCNILGKYQ